MSEQCKGCKSVSRDLTKLKLAYGVADRRCTDFENRIRRQRIRIRRQTRALAAASFYQRLMYLFIKRVPR
ncbi:MAG: hypothetical protein KAS32_25525 [Candidatus Peribacteraceae bacterium]|nr:hypothetical protein [Candidatus Peribacteraceae bacterium]